jgi:hypothetical protein
MGEVEAQQRQKYAECRARIMSAQPRPREIVAPAPAPGPAPAFLWKGKPYLNVVWDVEAAPPKKVTEPEPAPRVYPSVYHIMCVVAAEFGVSLIDMQSARRTQELVRPRQTAMYLAKRLTLQSLPQIGRCFGGRDHTTVLHAVRKVEGLMPGDPELVALVAKLEARVSAQ